MSRLVFFDYRDRNTHPHAFTGATFAEKKPCIKL